MLNIKYSTAKAIVKRYKETGVLSARLKSPEEPQMTVKQEYNEDAEPSRDSSNSGVNTN